MSRIMDKIAIEANAVDSMIMWKFTWKFFGIDFWIYNMKDICPDDNNINRECCHIEEHVKGSEPEYEGKSLLEIKVIIFQMITYSKFLSKCHDSRYWDNQENYARN